MCGRAHQKYFCIVLNLLDRQRETSYDIYTTSKMDSQRNSELQIMTDLVSASCSSTMPLARREKRRGPQIASSVRRPCKTKPILGRGLWDCGLRIADWEVTGRSCETKPNLGGMGCLGTIDVAFGAVPQRGNSCETKPMGRPRGPGIADCGRRIQRWGAARNKANPQIAGC